MLLYVGGDPDFVCQLEEQYPNGRIAVAGFQVSDVSDLSPSEVIILDLDGVSDPLAQLIAVREKWLTVPLIVVGSLGASTIGTIRLSRLHGADAFFLKPIADWTEVRIAIAGALARLRLWMAQIERATGCSG
jgi:hypothetical protein